MDPRLCLGFPSSLRTTDSNTLRESYAMASKKLVLDCSEEDNPKDNVSQGNSLARIAEVYAGGVKKKDFSLTWRDAFLTSSPWVACWFLPLRRARGGRHGYASSWARFTLDYPRPPTSLEELVEARYLGAIPNDPFTGSNETWQVETEQFTVTMNEVVFGIVDVHSGSDSISLEGTPYSSW